MLDFSHIQLGMGVDPATWTLICGVVWTLVQAALDKPQWTARRRKILVVGAAVVIAVLIWWAGAYPISWKLITTQIGLVLGYAWAAYQVLSALKIRGHSILDWAGFITPGGAAYQPPTESAGGFGDTPAARPRSQTSSSDGAQDPGTAREEDSSGA